PPSALYLSREEWRAALTDRRIHLTSPFHEPDSDRDIDFGIDSARHFAPDRPQNPNIYDEVIKHAAKLRTNKRKILLASYSAGARERLAGLLEDHGLRSPKQVRTWQEALGSSADATLMVLPLDHGFTTPQVAVLTEQD